VTQTDAAAARRRDRFHRAAWLAGILALVPFHFLSAQQTDSSQLNWVRRDRTAATQTTTQHSLTLAKPIRSAQTAAQPVADSESPAVLRWSTPSVSRARASGTLSDQPIKMVTASKTEPAPVRTVTQPTLVTDSEIPFRLPTAGDAPWERAAGATREPRELPKMDAGRDRLIQLVSQNQEIPDNIVPTEESEPRAMDPADTVGENRLSPPPVQEPLPPPAQSRGYAREKDEKEPCDRNYNERDCCEDEKRCGDARMQWQRDALAKISLDITPQLRPDELDPYKEESLRNADLAQSPVREWRNRQGTVITTGRLNNIQRGRLLVLDEDNQIVKIAFRDLSDDDLCFATAWWRVPNECTFGRDDVYLARSWTPSTLTWKATGVCHKPLYFEEPQLERYGHTTGHVVQPFLSGAHFFMNVVTLPYHAGINPPWECRYPLGYYRPGSCAPWLVPPVPLSVRGALWEAGVIAGGVAIIP
jgi:hypothetical protein